MNNLYWNAGKPISTEPQDVLTPERDAKKLVADPRPRQSGRGRDAAPLGPGRRGSFSRARRRSARSSSGW